MKSRLMKLKKRKKLINKEGHVMVDNRVKEEDICNTLITGLKECMILNVALLSGINGIIILSNIRYSEYIAEQIGHLPPVNQQNILRY